MSKIQDFKELKSKVAKKKRAQEIVNKKIEAFIRLSNEDLARDSNELIRILSNGSDEIKRLSHLLLDISRNSEITERLIERAKEDWRQSQ